MSNKNKYLVGAISTLLTSTIFGLLCALNFDLNAGYDYLAHFLGIKAVISTSACIVFTLAYFDV